MIRHHKNVSAARRRFAMLFKTALKNNGWSQTAFASKMQRELASERKMSAATISQWCNAHVIPKNKKTIEVAIAIVFRKKSSCEALKGQLREAYRDASQETNQNAEENCRALARLKTFLIPSQPARAATLCTMENVADLIADGQHTDSGTKHIAGIVKLLPASERAFILDAFVKILCERTSNDTDHRLQELLAATLTKFYSWRPSDSQCKSLSDMCRRDLAASWSPLAVSSSASRMLARAGKSEFLERTISAFVLDSTHGVDDFSRVAAYFGSEFEHFLGLMAHFRNKERIGRTPLILANDTNCLLRLADSPTLHPGYKRMIKPKLLLSGKLLYEAGMEREGRKAEAKANAMR